MLDPNTREAVTGIIVGLALSLIIWPVLYFLVMAWW